jgi:hypothetical protein
LLDFLKTVLLRCCGAVTSIERDRGYFIEKSYGIRTHKLDSKLQLFDYLSKYPLFGYKYFDQVYLEKVHNLFLNNEHKTLEGKNKLIEYANFMKKDEYKQYTPACFAARREHLKNFYETQNI